MSSQATGLRVASLLFGIISLVHLWRLFSHFDVQLGSYQLPIWVSGAGFIVAGFLSIWFWRLSSARG